VANNKISVLIDVTVDKANTALSSFKTSLAGADGAVGKFKAGAASIATSLKANFIPVAAVAGAAALKIGADAISAASDLNESANAVDVSFGRWSDAVHQMGSDSVDAFGLSERAFNDAAVSLAGFATAATASGGDVSATLQTLMTRATDFGSALGITTEEAIRVFSSTLAGEMEPIKKFGITMNAAEIGAYAVAEGMVKSAKEMTENDKVAARLGLTLEKTAKFQDDWANTSDELAGSQKKLRGEIEDLQAKLGETLLPVVTDVVNELVDGVDAANSFGDALGNIPLIDLPDLPNIGGWLRNIADATPFGAIFEFGNKAVRSLDDIGDFVSSNGRKFTNWLGVTHDEVDRGTRTYATYNAELMASVNTYDTATTMQREFGRALARGNVGLSDAAAAQDGYREAVGEARDATREQTDAVDALRRAHQDLAGDTLSTLEAEIAFREQVAESTEVLGDKNTTMDQAATAMIDVVRGAEDVAGAMLDEKNATMDTRAGMDLYNTSMLTQASMLEGPLQDAILRHVANMNGIPDEKISEILLDANPDNLAQVTGLIMTAIATVEDDAEVGGTEIGHRLGDGVIAGIDDRSGAIARAAEIMVEKALLGAKTKGKIKSPSALFEEEVGRPIAEGVAEGIVEDGDKIAEALVKSIEKAEKEAVDAAEDLVDSITDIIDDMWESLDANRSVEDMERSVTKAKKKITEAEDDLADAYADSTAATLDRLAAEAALNTLRETGGSAEDLEKAEDDLADAIERETEAQEDIVKAIDDVADAKERLEDASYKLAKATTENILLGPKQRQEWIDLATQAGLTKKEINELAASIIALNVAQGAAATATGAIGAEADRGQAVAAHWKKAIGEGLITAAQVTAVGKMSPAAQIEEMARILNSLMTLFGQTPAYADGGVVPGHPSQGQLAIVHGGETITPAGQGLSADGIRAAVSAGMVDGWKRVEQMRRAS